MHNKIYRFLYNFSNEQKILEVHIGNLLIVVVTYRFHFTLKFIMQIMWNETNHPFFNWFDSFLWFNYFKIGTVRVFDKENRLIS